MEPDPAKLNAATRADAASAAVSSEKAALQQLDSAFTDAPPLKTKEEREQDERKDANKRLSRRADNVAAYFNALIASGIPGDFAQDLVRDWHAQLPVNEIGHLGTAERAIRDLMNVARKP